MARQHSLSRTNDAPVGLRTEAVVLDPSRERVHAHGMGANAGGHLQAGNNGSDLSVPQGRFRRDERPACMKVTLGAVYRFNVKVAFSRC